MSDSDKTPPEDGNREDLERQRRDEEETRRLLRERGLVPRTAFIKDPATAKKKSKSAARVARFRDRQREAGLVQLTLPQAVAEAVKKAGGWPAYEAALRAAAPQAPPAVEVPRDSRSPELSGQDRADLDLGRRVRTLAGLRGRAVRWLLA